MGVPMCSKSIMWKGIKVANVRQWLLLGGRRTGRGGLARGTKDGRWYWHFILSWVGTRDVHYYLDLFVFMKCFPTHFLEENIDNLSCW